METLTAFANGFVSLCRSFGLFERDSICCGTVTVQQCVVLQRLLDGEHDVSSMASWGGVSNSAMTRLLDGLERKGYVDRVRSEADRRRVAIVLTELGRTEAERLRQFTLQALEAVYKAIPRDKRRQVVDSVRLLEQAIARTRVDFSACCGPHGD